MDFNVTLHGPGVIRCAPAPPRPLDHPNLKLCVLEAADRPAAHQSGRNSGVCHSGFNPAPGTLKARLCVEGNRLMREFCNSHSVRFQDVGTVVTAVNDVEIERLEKLCQRGEQNQVPERKSTRLNSSHGYISYADFRLSEQTSTTPTV